MRDGAEYGRPGMCLKPEFEEANADFESGDNGCSCHINPPCGYCTDERNILNLAEDDDAWESQLVYQVRLQGQPK